MATTAEETSIHQLLEKHSALSQSFEAAFHLKCRCGQTANDYVLQLNQALCGLCLKDLSNRRQLTVDSLGSLDIDPKSLYSKLSNESQSSYFTETIQLLYDERIKRLQSLKTTTLQKFSRAVQSGVCGRPLQLLKSLIKLKNQLNGCGSQTDKLRVVRGLKEVSMEVDEWIQSNKASSISKIMVEVKQEIEGRFRLMDQVISQLEQAVFLGGPPKQTATRSIPELPKLKDKFKNSILSATLDPLSFTPLVASTEFKVQRFKSHRARDWAHSKGSVDAIGFIPTQDLVLKGFVQYQVTDWKGAKTIGLGIQLYEEETLVYSDQVELKRRLCRENKVEVQFKSSLLTVKGKKYDICVRNLGEPFKSRCGVGSKFNEWVSFRKSRLDTNSTKVDEGQFFALIFSRKD